MAKISQLDILTAADGTEAVPVVKAGRAKRIALSALALAMTPFLNAYYKGDKGDTGGNVMSVGSFNAMRLAGAGAKPIAIGSGSAIVMTAFHTAARYGRAFYERRDDLTDDHLARFPRTTFKAIDETGAVTRWMLYNGNDWHFTDFGAVADDTTDCFPAYQEMEAVNAAFPTIGNYAYGFSGRTVRFCSGRFFTSKEWSLHARWDMIGAGGGAGGGQNTILRWPADTRGMICNRHNTDSDQVGAPFAFGRADGTTIRRMVLRGGGGTDRTKHGFWMRARATLEDVYITSFPGHNVNIVANSGAPDTQLGYNLTAGNANDWQMTRVSVQDSGLHGFFLAGIDPNAGHATGCEVLSAGCGGIVDVTFLGNTWTGCSVHTCNTRLLGRVYHNGYKYDLIDRTEGIGGATKPGTDANIWCPVQVDSGPSYYAPQWVAGNEYIISNTVFSDNPNSQGLFSGTYIEGGYPAAHVRPPAQMIGGTLGGAITSATGRIGMSGGFHSSPLGFGGSFVNAVLPDMLATYGLSMSAAFGTNMQGLGGEAGSFMRVLSSRFFDFRGVLTNDGSIAFTFANSPRAMILDGGFKANGQFGRAVRDRFYAIFPQGLVLRNDGNGRKISQGGAVPAAGTAYADGEVSFSSAPANRCLAHYSTTAATVDANGVITQEAIWVKAGALFVDATTVYDAPSLTTGSSSPEVTIAVAGAALGDRAMVSYVGDAKGVEFPARVSAANTVAFRARNPADNPTGTVDLPNATLKIRVEKM